MLQERGCRVGRDGTLKTQCRVGKLLAFGEHRSKKGRNIGPAGPHGFCVAQQLFGKVEIAAAKSQMRFHEQQIRIRSPLATRGCKGPERI